NLSPKPPLRGAERGLFADATRYGLPPSPYCGEGGVLLTLRDPASPLPRTAERGLLLTLRYHASPLLPTADRGLLLTLRDTVSPLLRTAGKGAFADATRYGLPPSPHCGKGGRGGWGYFRLTFFSNSWIRSR